MSKMKKVCLDLPIMLHTDLKTLSASKNIYMRELIIEALEGYIKLEQAKSYKVRGFKETKEIAEAIDNALDKLEGDFTDEQLQKALDRARLYPFVCDKAKSIPKYVKAKEKL